MSLTAEIEKEDKIRELEIVVGDQRAVIESQNLRIQELEVVVSDIGNGFHQQIGFSQNQEQQNGEQGEDKEVETNGYQQDED